MPEGLSTTEVAHAIHHQHEHATRGERHWHEELLEIIEATLLAIVAVATAWSGYQAARWDGRQAHLYGISSKERLLGTEATGRAGQLQLYDSSVFSYWLQATATGNTKVAELFQKRFRVEFRPAFDAWIATDPFHNPKAPPGPLVMPEYHNALAAKGAAYEQQASAAFEEGTAARETGDKYLRNTILLATVLFLTALAQRFKIRAVRITLLGVSTGLLVLALYFAATYPRA